MTDLFDDIRNGDGILGVFFNLLWNKIGKKHHELSDVYVPDTIVYSYSKPIAWYFTNKEGKIRKKNHSRLNSLTIEDVFGSRGRSISGVVAQYVTRASDPPERPSLSFAYYKESELRDFLLNGDKPDGLLQLFFDPAVQRASNLLQNSELHLTWGPGCHAVEKRVNVHKIDDYSISARERLNLQNFGRTNLATTTPNTEKKCIAIARSIAEHIRAVYRYNVTGLIMTFKVDKNDRPYLLYCESMRISSPDDHTRAVTCTVHPPQLEQIHKEEAQKLKEKEDEKKREELDAAREWQLHREEDINVDDILPCCICCRSMRREHLSQTSQRSVIYGVEALFKVLPVAKLKAQMSYKIREACSLMMSRVKKRLKQKRLNASRSYTGLFSASESTSSMNTSTRSSSLNLDTYDELTRATNDQFLKYITIGSLEPLEQVTTEVLNASLLVCGNCLDALILVYRTYDKHRLDILQAAEAAKLKKQQTSQHGVGSRAHTHVGFLNESGSQIIDDGPLIRIDTRDGLMINITPPPPNNQPARPTDTFPVLPSKKGIVAAQQGNATTGWAADSVGAVDPVSLKEATHDFAALPITPDVSPRTPSGNKNTKIQR